MKTMIARLLPALALLLAAPSVWAAPGDPGQGIPSTRHDFSGEAAIGGQNPGTCTYCHTPHSAQTTSLIWNQTAVAAAAYTWDETTTTGGTGYGTIATTNNGPSVKCLSCHDGSATVGDIGWFNAQDPTVSLTVAAAYQVADGANNLDGNHPIGVPYPFGAVANTYNGNTTGAAALLSDWIADPEALGIRLFNDTGGGTGISGGSAAATTGIECSSCHDR
jgi:hypothetical protein